MTWAFLLLSLFLCVRCTKFDVLAIILYVLLTGIHTLVGKFIPDSAGFTYYLSAAVTDFLIILSLSLVKEKSKLIIGLQKINLWFININLFGWLLFEAYYEPTAYNILCYVLYFLALVVIYRGGSNGLGFNRVTGRSSPFFGHNHKGGGCMPKDKGR